MAQSLPTPRERPSPTIMTTSLPILPQRTPAQAPPRPKLHINTTQLRTFGKGSSLRLDTLSAVSPTARNTFSNAYEPPAPSALATPLGRPSKPRLVIDSSVQTPTPTSASTVSASTLASASSNESATITIPYKQPHNLTSVLKNSPARAFQPRKMAPARPLFPAEKKVSFRTPLEEEIKTVKYTLAHSDIGCGSTSTLSSIEMTNDSETESSAASLSLTSTSSSDEASSPLASPPSKAFIPQTLSSLDKSPRPKGARAGEKRDSSESESDSDSCPETPVAGRRKRRRDWKWTLGPLPSHTVSVSSSSSSSTSSTTTSEANTSDDSS